MLHKNITAGDVHYLQQWEPADSSARTALAVTSADVGKVARQLDTNVFYLLMDDSPMTWADISSAGGSGTVTSVTSANADATVATTTTTPVITIVQAPALRSATTTVSVSAATAPTSGQVLTATSSTSATWQTPSGGGGGFTLATPQATTSGTTIDFTAIPSGTKVINVMLTGVSTNGTSPVTLRIGDSGGIETTSYLTTEVTFNSGSSGTNNYTNGFTFANGHDANVTYYGQLSLTLLNSSTNMWVLSGSIARSDALQSVVLTGTKTLSAELDRVQLTTVGGADTFDAGIMNISYS
jgi:hypothetical protein